MAIETWPSTLNGESMSTNKVILHGFLGKDPELKATPGGATLCRFSVATTENWKDKDGSAKSKTEWHNIVAWGKQGEAIEKFFKKGAEIIIEGKIEYTEGKNPADENKKIWYTHIKLNAFDFCGKKGESGGHHEPDPEQTGYADSDNNGGSGTNTVEDDSDIPF